MYQIVLTGPESTGKSTLAAALAKKYDTIWVEEYSRIYLNFWGSDYDKKDILNIAVGQQYWVQKNASEASHFLFADTYFLVLKVWSEFKYQSCHPWIVEQLQQSKVDLYVLCSTDIPWQADPLRENSNEREELLEIYRKELLNMSIPFIEVKGNMEERLEQVRTKLNQLEF